jgi:hypothetical protein
MAKLEGFTKVAVVKYGMCLTPYYFAIYDDGNDYQIGDMVLFSDSSNPNKINEIISVEEFANRTGRNITAEVIGKVDISAYEKRVEQRKKKEQLKKELQKELDESIAQVRMKLMRRC